MQPASGTAGLQVQQGHGMPELTLAERARIEMTRLTDRQRLLPGLMRDAAARGSYSAVADLRIELEQMPLRLWAAEYTAVQAELAERTRDSHPGQSHPRRPELLNRARELAAELHGRHPYPGLRPQ